MNVLRQHPIKTKFYREKFQGTNSQRIKFIRPDSQTFYISAFGLSDYLVFVAKVIIGQRVFLFFFVTRFRIVESVSMGYMREFFYYFYLGYSFDLWVNQNFDFIAIIV